LTFASRLNLDSIKSPIVPNTPTKIALLIQIPKLKKLKK
jgi:hypothetical protein